MEQIILVAHLLIALAIIGLVLLQQGKGADMGASFGAGSSQTLFGSAGSGNILTKATAWLVVLFFASSFSLALLANKRSAPADDLGLELPPAAEATKAPAQEELPVVDDAPAAAEAPASTPAQEDVPVLD